MIYRVGHTISLVNLISLSCLCSVLFLHPVHNYAILQYDPSLIGSTPVTEIDLAAASTSATASRALTLLSPTAAARRARQTGAQAAFSSSGATSSASGSGGSGSELHPFGEHTSAPASGGQPKQPELGLLPPATTSLSVAGAGAGTGAGAGSSTTPTRPPLARGRSAFGSAALAGSLSGYRDTDVFHGMDMAHTMAIDSASHYAPWATLGLQNLTQPPPPQLQPQSISGLPQVTAAAVAAAAVSLSTAAGPGYAPSPMHKGKIEHGLPPTLLSLGASASAAAPSPAAAATAAAAAGPSLPAEYRSPVSQNQAVPSAMARLRGMASPSPSPLIASGPTAGSASSITGSAGTSATSAAAGAAGGVGISGAATPSHGTRTGGTAATFPGEPRVPRYPGTASGGASGALRVGDEVLFVGLTASQMPVVQKATITKSERLITVDSSPPRYREHNAECLHVDRLAVCLGGVFVKASLLQQPFEALVAAGGTCSAGDAAATSGAGTSAGMNLVEEPPVTVGAMWASYAYADANDCSVHESSLAMPADIVADVVRPLRASAALLRQAVNTSTGVGTGVLGGPDSSISGSSALAARVLLPQLRSLDTEWKGVPLSKARQGLGLSPAWVARLEAVAGSKRHVLAVRRCLPRSHAHTLLREGDIVLAVNGRPVLTARDVEIAVQYTRPLPGPAATTAPRQLSAPQITGAGVAAGSILKGAEHMGGRLQAGASAALGLGAGGAGGAAGAASVRAGGATEAAYSTSMAGQTGASAVGTGSGDAQSGGGTSRQAAAPAVLVGSNPAVDATNTTAGSSGAAAASSSTASALSSAVPVPMLATLGPAGSGGIGGMPSSATMPVPAPASVSGDGIFSAVGGVGAGVPPPAGMWGPDPSEAVALTILRDGAESTVHVRPSLLRGFGTDRVIVWCGIMVQAAHEPVEARGFLPDPTPAGNPPYVSRWQYGSPAHKGGVRATQWITEVNGAPVRDLDGFLEAILSIGDRTDVRLRCVDLQVRSPSGRY